MDRRYLEKLHGRYGYSTQFLEKVYHLVRLLSCFSESGLLSRNLALKGGTAISFIYTGLQRLSIDVDFNFIGSKDRADMLRVRPEIIKEVRGIGEKLGYEYSASHPYACSRIVFGYSTAFGRKDRVKVEINFVRRFPVLGTVSKRLVHVFEDLPGFYVNTYRIEELAAMKIMILSERVRVKDIFDLFMLSRKKIDVKHVRRVLSGYSKTYNAEMGLEDIKNAIEGCDSAVLRRELLPYLPKGARFEFEKAKEELLVFLEEVLT